MNAQIQAELSKLFHFVWVDNKAPKTLFLLHGTGGDEQDLLPFVDQLKSQYNFVGLRGNVVEQGLRRFFVRSPEGVFDQVSLATESDKLATFLELWQAATHTMSNDWAFLGYSNGANMMSAMTLRHSNFIQKGVFLHGMLSTDIPPELDLKKCSFLVTYGEYDTLIPADRTQAMVTVFEQAGARVKVITHTGGHEVKKSEVLAAHQFLGEK